jgi:tetratricopeptide (TPR) repeat protein
LIILRGSNYLSGEVDVWHENLHAAVSHKPMRTLELIKESEYHYKNGDFDAALQKLHHALIIDLENTDAKRLLLDIYTQQDKTEFALDIVNELLEKDNKDYDLLIFKANCLNDLEQLDEALKLYNDIINEQSDLYLAYGARGILYYKMNQPEKALKDLNFSLKHEKKNALLFANRALVHIDKEDFKLALIDLNKALKIDNHFKEARLNRAFVLRMLGEKNKALKDIEKSDTETEDAEAYLQKGIVYFKNENNQKALEYYNLSIELDPNLVEAIYSRALVYCKLEEFEKSLSDLNTALEVDNSHFMNFLLNGFAYVYYKKKEYNQAIKYAEKTLEEYPDFYWANLTLSEIYGELEQKEEFYRNLKIAIKGGIGIQDIDETIRNKYSKDKEYKKLTKKLKKYGPYG